LDDTILGICVLIIVLAVTVSGSLLLCDGSVVKDFSRWLFGGFSFSV
jgi:hypothetical protein